MYQISFFLLKCIEMKKVLNLKFPENGIRVWITKLLKTITEDVNDLTSNIFASTKQFYTARIKNKKKLQNKYV